MDSKFYNPKCNPLGILECVDLRELVPGDLIVIQYTGLSLYLTLIDPAKGEAYMESKIGLDTCSRDMVFIQGAVKNMQIITDKLGQPQKMPIFEEFMLRVGWRWGYITPPGSNGLTISTWPIQALHILSENEYFRQASDEMKQ